MPTRAEIESVLIRRCGKLLLAADLDGTTIDGTNADLSDPIAWAVRQCGASVASFSAVTDADVAGMAAGDLDRLLDLAELRTLESALGNLDAIDIVLTDGHAEKLSQLGLRLEGLITRKRSQIARDYGAGLGSLSAGAIALSFQEQNACD